MPPKAAFDPNAIHYIKMKVVGGEVAPAAALAPKCSPIGMPPKKVGEDIQKATKDWKGLKVEVQVKVQNKQCEVSVLPTAAPLLLKEMKKTGRDRKKVKMPSYAGNLKLDQIKGIAEKLREKSFSATIQGVVMEVLGTCVSLGCTVEGKSPKEVQAEIRSGAIEIE